MCKNYYDWFYSGLKVSKGLISCNASPIRSFSCPSPLPFIVTFANHAIEIWAPKEFRDGNKSSSTYIFTLLNSALVSWVFNRELFFFAFFLNALFLVVDSLANLFSFSDIALAIVNRWWKSKNFTHSQGFWIVFPFVPSKTFFIININVNCLHTFCDAEDLFIPTSCDIFYSHTGKHLKTHKKQWFHIDFYQNYKW